VNQQDVSIMSISQEDLKGAVDTAMILDNNVPINGTLAGEQERQQNTDNEALGRTLHVSHGIPNNFKEAVEDMVIDGEENKTGDLDIESMLAAIHNDTPHPDIRNAQMI